MDSDLFSRTIDDQQHRGSDPPARCTARSPTFSFLRQKDTILCAFAFMSLTGSAFSSAQRKARDFVTLAATAIRYAGRPFSVRFRTLYYFIQSLTYYMPFHQLSISD